MKKIIVTAIAISLLLCACGPGQALGPTITPSPTITSTPVPTSTPSPSATPTFTPTPIGGESGKIVFVKEEIIDQHQFDNLFMIDLNTNEDFRLTDNNNPSVDYFFPVFSPDGNKIVFEKYTYYTYNTSNELFIMNIDDLTMKKISPAPMFEGNKNISEILDDGQPAWSPDGKTIVFSSNRHSLTNYSQDYEIFTINLENFEIVQLTKAYNSSRHPHYSPDGTKIVFMSNRETNWHIYIMDADGNNVKKITTGNTSNRFPTWSPDGKSIIFHSDRDGNLELYLYRLNDETIERLTVDPSDNATASFSPDSNWIVYQSDGEGKNDLYIMNLNSKESKKITQGEFENTVADWSRK